MKTILLTLALSPSLCAMKSNSSSDISASIQEKQILLSTIALQNSFMVQTLLEEIESGYTSLAKTSRFKREITQAVVDISGKDAIPLINQYHMQINYKKWYNTLKLADLLVLCGALHYLESPVHERGSFIYSIGKKTLEENSLSPIKTTLYNPALVSIALDKIQKMGNKAVTSTLRSKPHEATIEQDQKDIPNTFLTAAHGRAYLYSASKNRLIGISLSENGSRQSWAMPIKEKVTSLFCGADEKVFAGTSTGKVFQIIERRSELIAESITKKAIQKIYSAPFLKILAHTAHSVLWKIGDTKGRLFEKEYENLVSDCIGEQTEKKIIIALADSEKTKILYCTPFGIPICEETVPLKHARLSPDGSSFLGILQNTGNNGFSIKHRSLKTGAEETFLIEGSYAIDEYIDSRKKTEFLLPWSGGIAGLPSIDIGFSSLGNFFYIQYEKGRVRIVNTHSGAYQDLIQTYSPTIHLYETGKKLFIIRSNGKSLATSSHPLPEDSGDGQNRSLERLLLYAAMQYSYHTKKGLSLNDSLPKELCREFQELPVKEQLFCRENFCVHAAGI